MVCVFPLSANASPTGADTNARSSARARLTTVACALATGHAQTTDYAVALMGISHLHVTSNAQSKSANKHTSCCDHVVTTRDRVFARIITRVHSAMFAPTTGGARFADPHASAVGMACAMQPPVCVAATPITRAIGPNPHALIGLLYLLLHDMTPWR